MALGAQQLRMAELTRRVAALPTEINAWTARVQGQPELAVHSSQLKTLAAFMAVLTAEHAQLLAGLGPQTLGFTVGALTLVSEINRAQKIWDFFRDKLSLRFSPDFADGVWVADAIAWSCHAAVLERASGWGAVRLDEVREPPLTYLTAELSPATWARGTRPMTNEIYDLGRLALPIAVIELPWDHLVNAWELLSIAHEAAHDLEADLRLDDALKASLEAALAQLPPDRAMFWRLWRREVFADLLAMQLAGPAFVETLMHLLLLPDGAVYALDPTKEHPTPYLRILLDAAYLRTLVSGQAPAELDSRDLVVKDADRIAAAWTALYPQPPAALQPYLADFETVWKALLDEPLAPLQGHTARELAPYLAADDLRIRRAASFLATGANGPGKMTMKARHCVSAARLALNELPAAGAEAAMSEVHRRAMQLVRDNTPPGVRGGSKPSAAFINAVAKKFIESAGKP